jgi:hypothetical protein
MRPAIIFLFCILLPMRLISQNRLCIGKSDTIYSSVLNEERIENGLRLKWKEFAEESHGTIPIPGMADAFKTILK